jgi:hypothetical protein
MKPDLGIAPVREVREAVSRSVDNDPARLVDYYLALQQRFADQLLHAPADVSPDSPAADDPAGTTRVPR